jgi:hypothetical protein
MEVGEVRSMRSAANEVGIEEECGARMRSFSTTTPYLSTIAYYLTTGYLSTTTYLSAMLYFFTIRVPLREFVLLQDCNTSSPIRASPESVCLREFVLVDERALLHDSVLLHDSADPISDVLNTRSTTILGCTSTNTQGFEETGHGCQCRRSAFAG